LAIYDRFGRLIHGHPHVAKDVLEYVVYEKHMANIYGSWRLHAKIMPDWLQKQRPPGTITHILHHEVLPEATEEVKKPAEAEVENDDKDDDTILDRYGNAIKKKD
jgi:large subunit ribosomal protein L45